MEYETSRKKDYGAVLELVLKGRADRLWEYYGRHAQEVRLHDYRRKGEV